MKRLRSEEQQSERLLAAEEKSLEGGFGRIIGFYERCLLGALRRPLGCWRQAFC